MDVHDVQTRLTGPLTGQRAGDLVSTMPEDAALYLCGCGSSFMAPVSTNVTCPACGHGQVW